VDRAGADASRLLWRKVSEPSIIRGIPADASGAAWPCPQTNDRIFSEKAAYGHPSLNGYSGGYFFIDKVIWLWHGISGSFANNMGLLMATPRTGRKRNLQRFAIDGVRPILTRRSLAPGGFP